ncbi:hypothetical protein [Clostridium rectalis]|uniref:hypothetical protein n=1 Tax=Clostridium rectalis TaxID=2040295 RepID=UPI000F634A9B|nr:hypothetical protein [Clostridium rectalis]
MISDESLMVLVESLVADGDSDKETINIYLIDKTKTISDFAKELNEEFKDSLFNILYIGNKNTEFINKFSKEYIDSRFKYLIDFYKNNKYIYKQYSECKVLEKYDEQGNFYNFFKKIDKIYKIKNKFTIDEMIKNKECFFKTCYIDYKICNGNHSYWNDSESEYANINSFEGFSMNLVGRIFESKFEENKENYKDYCKKEIESILEAYLQKNIYNKDTFIEFNRWGNIKIELGFSCNNDEDSIISLLERSIIENNIENDFESLLDY